MSSRTRSSSVSSVRSRSQAIISTITARPPSRSTDRASGLRRSRSFSRSASAQPRGRSSKLNTYRNRSAANSVDHIHSTLDSAPRPKATGVRRWDGNARTTTKWDSIRKDSELWFPKGDCLIHFYERGSSRRGASLRVSLADIEACHCETLLEQFYHGADASSPFTSTDSGSDGDSPDDFHSPASYAPHELYIPAPEGLNREDAFQHHLTTRNFFAFMFEKPIVADCLGQSLASLMVRINEYRPGNEHNQEDMMAYVDGMGYTDFGGCPDHALALLQFAETFQLKDLWTDAFVHCVGMNNELDSSSGFEHVSRASQALITRAHIEMQVRLERAGRSVSDFLEEDLLADYLGLSKEAYSHLERFRSFLHSYYVQEHSYWPPAPVSPGSTALPRSVYENLQSDIRSLYEYLVDSDSTVSVEDSLLVDVGLQTFRKVAAFDKRNKHTPLAHPLPLTPKITHVVQQRRAFSRLSIFSSRRSKLIRRVATACALANATNIRDPHVMENRLVREYLLFEKSWTMKESARSGISSVEGRRLRWILVYALLQTLTSVTKVPPEVRDTQNLAYPLCCQTAGTPPWQFTSVAPPAAPTPKPVEAKVRTGTNSRSKTISPLSLKEAILAKRRAANTSPLPIHPALRMPAEADSADRERFHTPDAHTPPLSIPNRHENRSQTPKRISFANRLNLRAPKPVRQKSWDVLSQDLQGADSPTLPPPMRVPIPESRSVTAMTEPAPVAMSTLSTSSVEPTTPTTPNGSHGGSTTDSSYTPSSPSSSSDVGDNGSNSDGMSHRSVILANGRPSSDIEAGHDDDVESDYGDGKELDSTCNNGGGVTLPLTPSPALLDTRPPPPRIPRGRARESIFPIIPMKSTKRRSFHAPGYGHSHTSSDSSTATAVSVTESLVANAAAKLRMDLAREAEAEDDDDEVLIEGEYMGGMDANRELDAYLSS